MSTSIPGGEILLSALSSCGVEICLANPGTSEMHAVAALSRVPQIRGVLGLQENVVTGAADGYARMAGKPAATLLHLGPGLANGTANLHNAARAHSPIVNVVGDHATYHKRYDAPLESDIESLARPVSSWIRRVARTDDIASDAAAAYEAAMTPPGGVATLILPSDLTWNTSEDDSYASGRVIPPRVPHARLVPPVDLEPALKALCSGKPTTIFLDHPYISAAMISLARQVCSLTGAKLIGPTFPARLEHGLGVPTLERLAYLAELASAQLAGCRHLVLVGARSPVSFFAYPGQPSDLVPAGCRTYVAAGPADDCEKALADLLDGCLLHAHQAPGSNLPGGDAQGGDGGQAHLEHQPPGSAIAPRSSEHLDPDGRLDARSAASVLAALLPESAIVSDEGNTAGLYFADAMATSPPHDWLCLTGGAIGQGLPVATGAALACPDRPVIAIEADGSAMYTFQALWTQAREDLDVTTIILDNGAYEVLEMELMRVNAEGASPHANAMLELRDPSLDFVSLARGLGVPGQRAETVGELREALSKAFAEPGPHLVQAAVGRLF